MRSPASVQPARTGLSAKSLALLLPRRTHRGLEVESRLVNLSFDLASRRGYKKREIEEPLQSSFVSAAPQLWVAQPYLGSCEVELGQACPQASCADVSQELEDVELHNVPVQTGFREYVTLSRVATHQNTNLRCAKMHVSAESPHQDRSARTNLALSYVSSDASALCARALLWLLSCAMVGMSPDRCRGAGLESPRRPPRWTFLLVRICMFMERY